MGGAIYTNTNVSLTSENSKGNDVYLSISSTFFNNSANMQFTWSVNLPGKLITATEANNDSMFTTTGCDFFFCESIKQTNKHHILSVYGSLWSCGGTWARRVPVWDGVLWWCLRYNTLGVCNILACDSRDILPNHLTTVSWVLMICVMYLRKKLLVKVDVLEPVDLVVRKVIIQRRILSHHRHLCTNVLWFINTHRWKKI